MNNDTSRRGGRRAFLHGGTLVLAAGTLAPSSLLAVEDEPRAPLRIALMTDLHYADKPPVGTRHYRESFGKLTEAVAHFNHNKPDMLVEMGDLIDAADSIETERGYLATINGELSKICDDRHYVLGNHCVATLTKEEFLSGVSQEKSYYSFDRGDFHFIVLDSCFRHDGQPYGRNNFKWNDANIPTDELKWMKADLQKTLKQVVVFAHQRLDVADDHGVRNNTEVRQVLEASQKVLAVFQGHSHKNDLKDIEGIHYCTLVAMVEGSGRESSGYTMMEIDQEGTIRVNGYRRQETYRWT